MSVEHVTLDELIAGSPLHIVRQVAIPAGAGTIEKCWLTIKENYTQTDDQAIIKKSITATATGDGQILDAGATGSGQILFNLLPIETKKFIRRTAYVFDIWIKTTNDDPTGVTTGLILAHAAVTLDPT